MTHTRPREGSQKCRKRMDGGRSTWGGGGSGLGGDAKFELTQLGDLCSFQRHFNLKSERQIIKSNQNMNKKIFFNDFIYNFECFSREFLIKKND